MWAVQRFLRSPWSLCLQMQAPLNWLSKSEMLLNLAACFSGLVEQDPDWN